jgi:hypothetical protein
MMISTPSITFDEFQRNVVKWAHERGIMAHSTSRAQLLKAFSEMGELADGDIIGDRDAQIDAIGDVLVCLVNYCELTDISIDQAWTAAWNVIKNRSGRMVAGGAFVKDPEPLPLGYHSAPDYEQIWREEGFQKWLQNRK